ncbi:unnamed protein product [Rotaria sordida]|uniref:Uncharacterized protein n=1 Tax=Rotaria sordida TaxID=392033 RepID=A0A820JK51_9BILA|nr:unnamed protein product [Rotaria sordida]
MYSGPIKMMNSIEKITTLFPNIDLLSVNSTNFNPSSSSVELPINSSTNDNTSDHVLSEVLVKQEMNLFFLDEYIIPTLPNSLLQDTETGALHKFGPHHTKLFYSTNPQAMSILSIVI